MSAIIPLSGVATGRPAAPGATRPGRSSTQRVAPPPVRGPRCELCGAERRVRVLENYHQGQPVFREFCIPCADRAPARAMPTDVDVRARLELSTTFLVLGLTVGTLALAADYLGVHGHGGFGWVQRAGLALGALLFGAAALLRVDVLGLFGLGVFAFSLVVDLARFGGSAGLGWKQQLAAFAAVLLLATCLWLRRRFHGSERSAIG